MRLGSAITTALIFCSCGQDPFTRPVVGPQLDWNRCTPLEGERRFDEFNGLERATAIFARCRPGEILLNGNCSFDYSKPARVRYEIVDACELQVGSAGKPDLWEPECIAPESVADQLGILTCAAAGSWLSEIDAVDFNIEVSGLCCPRS